jgi:fructose-bisphosphate aldolase/2-amino-3,7-dideoxy-D-threo-hept-6-ulosonate synthase
MNGSKVVPFLEQPGRFRRMQRLLPRPGHRTLGVPFDDLLISGPIGHLSHFDRIIDCVAESHVDFAIGFPWIFHRFGAQINSKAWIVNLTASTTLSHHTRKVIVGSVDEACALGADAVAVHVNFTDDAEGQMLASLSAVSRDCRKFGMPLLALAYVRQGTPNGDENYFELRERDSEAYANLVAHACHVVVELGADLVKTQYTGSVASFQRVIQAAAPAPVIVAGGPATQEGVVLKVASEALAAGAAGLCIGRNTYCRGDVSEFLSRLNDLL